MSKLTFRDEPAEPSPWSLAMDYFVRQLTSETVLGLAIELSLLGALFAVLLSVGARH